MIPNKRADGSSFPLSAEYRQNAGRKRYFGNWGTYAAAAGAALAMSTNASADIVYSGAEDVTASVAPGGGSSIKKFTVAGFSEHLYVKNLTARSHRGTATVTDAGGPPNLQFFGVLSNGDFSVGKNYHRGHAINGADGSFGPGAILRQHNTSNLVGAWGPGTVTSFLGFKVKSGALAGDLGWLEIKVSATGNPAYPDEAQVLGWAYNKSSGAVIDAGQTGVIATPEPAGVALGLLAIGAAGILAFRKRRNELAAK